MTGRIIATQYISLDGVIEDPVGMEDSGLGDWTGPYSRGPEGDKFKEDELRNASAMIFGRRTYDGFSAVWPAVPGDYAERMNALPKYLASRTIASPEWSNTVRLGDDLCASVAELKRMIDGNILIFGSGSVCHQLMRCGLIDEFSLILYPVVLGDGLRLFPENTRCSLELLENTELKDGLMLLRYGTSPVLE